MSVRWVYLVVKEFSIRAIRGKMIGEKRDRDRHFVALITNIKTIPINGAFFGIQIQKLTGTIMKYCDITIVIDFAIITTLAASVANRFPVLSGFYNFANQSCLASLLQGMRQFVYPKVESTDHLHQSVPHAFHPQQFRHYVKR